MAEALLAIGIAANVVQFLDVSTKLTSSCWKIYISRRDGVGALPDLQTITEDFERVLIDLERSGNDGKSLSEEDRVFEPLLVKCQESAAQLSEYFHKINSPGRARKRDAIWEAIKGLGKDEISSLQVRLERLRQELIVNLLSLIR